jgi:hypothetical protein
MRYVVRIGSGTLGEAIRLLEAESSGMLVVRRALGVSRLPGCVEYLLRGAEPARDGSVAAIVGARALVELPRRIRRAFDGDGRPDVVLGLGIGGARGYLAAARDVADQESAAPTALRSADAVMVVGPGMALVELLASPAAGAAPARRPDERSWSRTIGALGPETWRRLTALRAALAGCGRIGASMAEGLVRLGIEVDVIDPDVVELHNVGEMALVRPDDVGRRKVDAVASALGPRARAVPASVLSPSGLVACKRADVLVCSADRGSARLASAALAALFLRPLLDVGTGIFGDGPSRRMGADIRLVLPGSCLLCCGGLGDEAALAAAARGIAAPAARPATSPGGWRRERSGSLSSLNGVAVGLGLRQLEDLVGGRTSGTNWLRLEFDPAGTPTLEPRQPAPGRDCPLCRLTGAGDNGLSDAIRMMAGLGGPSAQ